MRSVAAAALILATSGSWALGLGRMAVQSALGESLRAEIDVTSITPEEASSLRVRIAPPEAYRAAGVDYGLVLSGTQVTLARRADGRPYLRIVSDRVVQEPFVDVILELSWASGRLVREYTMLLDPPTARTAAAPAPVRRRCRCRRSFRRRHRLRLHRAKPRARPQPRRRSAPLHQRQHRRQRPVPQRRARRAPPRPPPARSQVTNTVCAAATRCTGSLSAINVKARHWTRCWWHCGVVTRRHSLKTT